MEVGLDARHDDTHVDAALRGAVEGAAMDLESTK
jgi:hypothetical protein